MFTFASITKTRANMKKIFTFLFAISLFLGFALNAKAQFVAEVDIDDVIKLPNRVVEIPIFVDFDRGEVVRSFELWLDYNDNVIEFLGIANVADEFTVPPVNVVPGAPADPRAKLFLEWTDPGTDDLAAGFEGKLLDLQFYYNGGFSAITYVFQEPDGETRTEVGGGDIGGDFLLTEFIPGSINEETVPVPLSNWALFAGLFLIAGFMAFRMVKLS